jgi:hypothetical protein
MNALLALVLLFMIGCASTGNRQIMSANFSATLQEGVSTQSDVKTLLGEPQHYGEIQIKFQTITFWRYIGTDRSLNLAAFIPLVDIAAGRQTVLTKWVDCYFDPKGVLIKIDVQSDIKENVAPVGTLVLGVAAIGAAAGYAATPYRYGYPYYGHMYYGGHVVPVRWYR